MNEDPQPHGMEWLSARTRYLIATAGEVSIVGASVKKMPIKELFTAAGYPCDSLCTDMAPREHILYHMNAVDWSSYQSVKRMIPIVEAAVEVAEDLTWSSLHQDIVSSMAEDGLKVIGGKVFRRSPAKSPHTT